MANLQSSYQLREQLRELQHLAQSRTEQSAYEQQLYQTVGAMALQIDRLSRELQLLERRYYDLVQKKGTISGQVEPRLYRPRSMDYWHEQAKSYEEPSPQELEQHLQSERVSADRVVLNDADRERVQRYQAVSAEERVRAEHYRDQQTSQPQASAADTRYWALMLLIVAVLCYFAITIILR